MATQIDFVKELNADSRNWHKQYPWFSIGQLIHTSNKKGENDFHSVAQATAIFFNDIHRLHWLLNERVFDKNTILSELNIALSAEVIQSSRQPFSDQEHFKEITISAPLIPDAAIEDTQIVEAPIAQQEDEIVNDILGFQNAINFEGKHIGDNFGEKKEGVLKIESEHSVQATTKKIEAIFETNKIEERKNVEKIENEIEEELNDSEAIITTNDAANAAKAQENIRASLDLGNKMEVAFEPYHTIDYFASQGIKVDIKADDRLGKQLKSFTSWLKTMKRLPVTEEETPTAVISQFQDRSLENTNVVTEAMAAVLLKQGKKEQAIEIMKQLILLHPQKSRYFAAQIEQIKN